jgi:hypothetical protein
MRSRDAADIGADPLSPVPLVGGTLLAIVGLFLLFGRTSTNFEELALGTETSAYYAVVGGVPIHCTGVMDSQACLDGVRDRSVSMHALWLGNSQLHGVNQLRDGEENGPAILFRRLEKAGIDLVTFSQPNANLQEHLVLYAYLAERQRFDYLIVPVVFDDLRETGLRQDIATALEDPATRARLMTTELGRAIDVRASTSGGDSADFTGVSQTFQERSERLLNEWLERHVALWRTRAEARGKLFEWAYQLRNSVFGITAQTERRMIAGRYVQNLAALETLLEFAREDGVRVLVYVVPLRQDVPGPYVAEEYRDFKFELASRVSSGGAALADLEALVPAQYWGAKDATRLGGAPEIDFMHFQAAGHSLLANALGDLIEHRLTE